jgi:hypothetical protein
MENQLAQFGLNRYMDNITYVTDRGSNFRKAFRSHKILHCVAHRLNNILKRYFYQNPVKKTTGSSKNEFVHPVTTIIKIQETPKKKKTISTTYFQASPEVEEDAQIVHEDES